MDVSQTVARQADSFVRTVARASESTGASLAKAEEKLRRDVPEAVAACQALLDEQLPLALQAATAGDLRARVEAAVLAHDAGLGARAQELQALTDRLVVQQDQQFLLAAAAQRERHAAELQAALTASDAVQA